MAGITVYSHIYDSFKGWPSSRCFLLLFSSLQSQMCFVLFGVSSWTFSRIYCSYLLKWGCSRSCQFEWDIRCDLHLVGHLNGTNNLEPFLSANTDTCVEGTSFAWTWPNATFMYVKSPVCKEWASMIPTRLWSSFVRDYRCTTSQASRITVTHGSTSGWSWMSVDKVSRHQFLTNQTVDCEEIELPSICLFDSELVPAHKKAK